MNFRAAFWPTAGIFLLCSVAAPADPYDPHAPLPDPSEAWRQLPVKVPTSKWAENRKHRYGALLEGWTCDTLVVPVQVQAQGFDRASRLIMSGELARALADGSRCVVDPYLAERVLGEGRRRYEADEIAALADQVKASKVVSAYAGGSDWRGHMRITVELRERSPEGALVLTRKRGFGEFPFDAQNPPFEIFSQWIPKLVEALGLTAGKPASPASQVPLFPVSPQAMLQDESNPLGAALRLMQLGMLAPASESLPSASRLYARAWVALLGVNAQPELVARLRSRALLHLNERPRALELIKGQVSPDAAGLRAMLNGDLPSARAAYAQAPEGAEKAFLAAEINALEWMYGRDNQDSGKQLDRAMGGDWTELVNGVIEDHDSWRVPDPIAYKKALDRLLPIAGQSTEDVMRGLAVTGQGADAQMLMLPAEHVHASLEKRRQAWCCHSYTPASGPLDLLDLLDDRAAARLLQVTSFIGEVQGNFASGIGLLDFLAPELSGNPEAEGQRAFFEWAQLNEGPAPNRQAHRERMIVAARMAALYQQGQAGASIRGLWYLAQPPKDDIFFAPLAYYAYDFPPLSIAKGADARTQLAFTTDNAQPFNLLAEKLQGAERTALLAELDHRLVGAPGLVALRLERLGKSASDPAKVEQLLDRDPGDWDLRQAASNLYVRAGAFARAADVVARYPAFQLAKPQQTVGLSNNAYEASRPLFWHGASEARQLLKIAAGYNNGSRSCVTAAARLALMNGDWLGASRRLLESAQHYRDAPNYRDYLSLLFASGDSASGWAGWTNLATQLPNTRVWRAAMVGHRRDSAKDKEVADWLLEQSRSADRELTAHGVADLAIDEFVVDRGSLPSGFAATIEQVAGPSGVSLEPSDQQYYEGAAGQRQRVGPSRLVARPVSAGPFADSRALFARALAALARGDDDGALAAFNDYAATYDISKEAWDFVLPYYAVAAARRHDPLGLEKFLSALPETTATARSELALGVFAALGKRQDAAKVHFDKAFGLLDGPSEMPLGDAYMYADLCMRMARETGNADYRKRALAWTRAYRQVDPTFAWPHALSALLSSDEDEKVSELAVALWLDPASAWAGELSPGYAEKAQAWLKTHKPFAILASRPSA